MNAREVSDADEDRDWLTAWQAGDRDAGARLLERYHGRVFRFFRDKLPGNASDLAQQTFLAALEGKARIVADRSFRAYLFGIARNLLYDELRRKRPDQAIGDEASLADVGLPSASLGVAMREERRLLLQCLHQLPIDHQLALELYYWEELSTPDIAAILEVPEGTVRSRLTRARDRLRELLAIAAPRLAAANAEQTQDEFDRWARGLDSGVESDRPPTA